MSKELNIDELFKPIDAPKTLEEIHAGPDIAVVEGEKDFRMDDFAFSNELVTIVVAEDGSEGAVQVITPQVGGINQPIIRGIEQTVKRKYVEALAHAVTTSYRQETPNPHERDRILNVPKTVPAYSFTVTKDTDRGRAWLKDLVRKQALAMAS